VRVAACRRRSTKTLARVCFVGVMPFVDIPAPLLGSLTFRPFSACGAVGVYEFHLCASVHKRLPALFSAAPGYENDLLRRVHKRQFFENSPNGGVSDGHAMFCVVVAFESRHRAMQLVAFYNEVTGAPDSGRVCGFTSAWRTVNTNEFCHAYR